MPIVMGICATASVLLQQGCNNINEGKEAKKIEASHQNKFVHILMPQLLRLTVYSSACLLPEN